MPITYLGGDIIHTATGTNDISADLPEGYQAGDFAIAFGRCDEAGTVPTLGMTAGWTEQRQDNWTEGRDRVEAIWTRVLESDSETSPNMTIDVAEERSLTVHVFRGVDPDTPLDATITFDHADAEANPTNPAIVTVTDNAAIVLLHGFTANDHTVLGAPSGYTLSEGLISDGNNQRGQATAYLLDAGAAGTKTPGAWTHTASPTDVSAYSTYTLALRAAFVAEAYATSGVTQTTGQQGSATVSENVQSIAQSGASQTAGQQGVAMASANVTALSQTGVTQTVGQTGVAAAGNNSEARAQTGSTATSGQQGTATATANVVALAASGVSQTTGQQGVALNSVTPSNDPVKIRFKYKIRNRM